MANVRVYRAMAETWYSTSVRVYKLQASAEQSAAVRVYRSEVGLSPAVARVRVFSVKASTSGSVVSGPDQFDVEPFATVTLTANAGTWSQVSGDTVALVGSGSTVTFRAPGSLTAEVLRFQASDGTTSDSTEVSVTPHSVFTRASSDWAGRQSLTRGSGAWS